MPRVYLICQPTLDRHTGDAAADKTQLLARWGEVVVLAYPGEYTGARRPDYLLDKITARLKDFDPEQDFVAWAGGDSLSALLVGVVLADAGFDRFRWLRYERPRDPVRNVRTEENAQYVPVTIPLYPSNDEHQHDDAAEAVHPRKRPA